MTAYGVLGGSFDPVHRGHIALALAARSALGLRRVLLLPCARPPHKPDRRLVADVHRLEMLYLAVEGHDGLAVSTFELARGGVRYTIDTLRALREDDRSGPPVFVIGSDALSEIPTWREHQALLREFDLVAGTREDVTVGAPRQPSASPLAPGEFANLGAGGRVLALAASLPPVSSSLVRARCAAGEAIDDLVPAPVARYIQRHRLYAGEGRR